MDPDETLRVICDRQAKDADRQRAISDLLDWIDGVGFLPTPSASQLAYLLGVLNNVLTLQSGIYERRKHWA